MFAKYFEYNTIILRGPFFRGHVCLLSHHTVVWGILSLLCVIFLIVFLYDFSVAEKRYGREILHAHWPTIRTCLLPFW